MKRYYIQRMIDPFCIVSLTHNSFPSHQNSIIFSKDPIWSRKNLSSEVIWRRYVPRLFYTENTNPSMYELNACLGMAPVFLMLDVHLADSKSKKQNTDDSEQIPLSSTSRVVSCERAIVYKSLLNVPFSSLSHLTSTFCGFQKEAVEGLWFGVKFSHYCNMETYWATLFYTETTSVNAYGLDLCLKITLFHHKLDVHLLGFKNGYTQTT
jgi:hypothetical protein